MLCALPDFASIPLAELVGQLARARPNSTLAFVALMAVGGTTSSLVFSLTRSVMVAAAYVRLVPADVPTAAPARQFE